jgi:hypothetical protein
MADPQQPQQKSIQDIMSGELFASSRSDMVETLKFMEKHGTPLSERQVAAVGLLRVLQKKRNNKVYEPIIQAMSDMSKEITPPGLFVDVIEKMTLGGFVTGKVRMSKLVGNGGDR